LHSVTQINELVINTPQCLLSSLPQIQNENKEDFQETWPAKIAHAWSDM